MTFCIVLLGEVTAAAATNPRPNPRPQHHQAASGPIVAVVAQTERIESASSTPDCPAPSARPEHQVFVLSNERGLPRAGDAIFRQSGRIDAVAGVSGGVLDLACRVEANCVVSMDDDPWLRTGIRIVRSMLLTTSPNRGPWNCHRAQDAFVERLGMGASHAQLRALSEYGITPENAPGLEQVLVTIADALRADRRSELEYWFEGPHGKRHVAHLRKLAQRGRILAVTRDISDPAAPQQLIQLLDRLDTRLGIFNLSNVMDNFDDVAGVANVLDAIASRYPEALIVSTSVGCLHGLGSFAEPAVQSIDSTTNLLRRLAAQTGSN